MDQFNALIEFLKTYGAPVVLVWAMIETDLVFLVVGALAHAGYINPYACIPAAVLGATLHDLTVFWLARNRAEWVRSRKAYQKLSATVGEVAQKMGPLQLTLCRPLYGTRYPTIIFWGLELLSYPRFLFHILLGLVPWVALLVGIGFSLWTRLEDFDDWLAVAKNWIFGAVLVAGALWYLRRRFNRKHGVGPTPPPASPSETSKPESVYHSPGHPQATQVSASQETRPGQAQPTNTLP